jgi:hypothetical protein
MSNSVAESQKLPVDVGVLLVSYACVAGTVFGGAHLQYPGCALELPLAVLRRQRGCGAGAP